MIDVAKASPREEGGILYWYCGDTFFIRLTLELRNGDTGALIPYLPSDTVCVVWRDEAGAEVHRFDFTEIGEDHTVELQFDTETTAKFRCGNYTYSVKKNGQYVKTLIKNNRARVE